MSEDQPGSSKEFISGCSSPTRVDSSSSKQSDLPIIPDFDPWITSTLILGSSRQTRPSSWDDSEDETSPITESGSQTHRIYSGASRKFQESISLEIDEFKQEFFQSLDKSSVDGDQMNDRRQSPARIRRRTRSSSGSSPILDPKNEAETNEEKILHDETESKILELDSNFYLNNFFTELRSRRISLFNSSSMEDNPEIISDQNDDVFCRTSRKLSQILEVEEAKRDLDNNVAENDPKKIEVLDKDERDFERNFEQQFSHRSMKSSILEDGEIVDENSKKSKKIWYKSPSFESTVRKDMHATSVTERCEQILRYVDEKNTFSTTRLGSPGWRRSDAFQVDTTFVENLKSDLTENEKFKLNLGRESMTSLVMEDMDMPGIKMAISSSVRARAEEELNSGKSSESELDSFESPRVELSSRSLRLDNFVTSSNITPKSEKISTSSKSSCKRKKASNERTFTDRVMSVSPRSAAAESDNSDSEGGIEEQEERISGVCSYRSEESGKKGLSKSPTEGNTCRFLKNTIIGRTLEQDPEEEENTSSRSKISSDRDQNKRLTIINEDLELNNINLDEQPSSTDNDKKTAGGGMWDEIIEAFDGNQNSSSGWKANFPGFPKSSARELNSPSGENIPKIEKENLEEDSFTHSRRLAEMESKVRSPKKNSLGKRLEKEQEISHDSYLEENSVEKPKTEEHPRTFYLDVSKATSFGIGEFGDITCWNVGKSDHIESEKPKDHGDGFKTAKLVDWATYQPSQEKKEKDSKTQRQLWTELRKDFREKKCPMQEDTFFFPNDLRPSKSDNYIAATSEKEKIDFSRKRKREISSTSKSTIEKDSSSEDEDFEFEKEAVRRLTSSMSNIHLSSGNGDALDDPEENLLDVPVGEVESANLNKEKEEITTAANNWLILKNPEGRQPRRQKRRKKSGKSSSRVYLYDNLSQASVPRLKLKNSNCFQNFYKRVISVFCVTSASSVATSK